MAKVLLVDDDPDVLEVLKMALEDDGFQTVEALSGEAAIDIYRTEQPDAVLLDLSMPTMDGVATLAELRRMDPNARVAILTGVGTQAAVKQALAAGACAFVLKPFDLERVRITVDNLVAA